MEIWDGYYEDGTKSGKDLIRGEDIPEGMYHLVCEALVRHADGDYLLMLRDPNKDIHPGEWEATAGGSALKGENPLACVERELLEETGIIADTFEEIAFEVYQRKHSLFHSFLCIVDCNKDSVTLQKGETSAYRWVSEREFIAFVNSGEMMPGQQRRYEAYFSKMGYRYLKTVSEQEIPSYESLIAEYLPGSDIEKVREQYRVYPDAQIVAMDHGRVIGCAFGWKATASDYFCLEGLAVTYEYWRQGIGSGLLKKIEQTAKRYGFAGISLGSADGFVEHFYLANGYHPTCYKIYRNDSIVKVKDFHTMMEYESYNRPSEEGFVVMEKEFDSYSNKEDS